MGRKAFGLLATNMSFIFLPCTDPNEKSIQMSGVKIPQTAKRCVGERVSRTFLKYRQLLSITSRGCLA